jgi:hypothetical protein
MLFVSAPSRLRLLQYLPYGDGLLLVVVGRHGDRIDCEENNRLRIATSGDGRSLGELLPDGAARDSGP